MAEKKLLWRSKSRLIDINEPCVMGIINCTPDSFFEGSRAADLDEVLRVAEGMLIAGAAILDIGGASTRPGALQPGFKEEINRVAPAILAIRKRFPDVILSIDTYRTEVADAALDAGADIVNDISGLNPDEGMWDLVAKYKVPYLVMAKEGDISNMHKGYNYDDIVMHLLTSLSNIILKLSEQGIDDVIVDPGFGFSKSLDDNYTILKNLHIFRMLNKPILVGVSRKSMIYKFLEISQDEALPATTALHLEALRQGAAILRVHDVPEAVQVIKLYKMLYD